MIKKALVIFIIIYSTSLGYGQSDLFFDKSRMSFQVLGGHARYNETQFSGMNLSMTPNNLFDLGFGYGKLSGNREGKLFSTNLTVHLGKVESRNRFAFHMSYLNYEYDYVDSAIGLGLFFYHRKKYANAIASPYLGVVGPKKLDVIIGSKLALGAGSVYFIIDLNLAPIRLVREKGSTPVGFALGWVLRSRN